MTPNQSNLNVQRQFRGSSEAKRGSMWDIMAAARLQFDCQCHLPNLSQLGSYAMTAAKPQFIMLTDIFGANTTESVLEKYGINRILDRNPSNGVWVLPLRTICWVSQITVPNQPTNSAKKKATQLHTAMFMKYISFFVSWDNSARTSSPPTRYQLSLNYCAPACVSKRLPRVIACYGWKYVVALDFRVHKYWI